MIAEEVEELYPELVIHDEEGEALTIKYHLLPALLIKEIQGNHTTIAQHEKTIALLKKIVEDYDQQHVAIIVQLKETIRDLVARIIALEQVAS